MATGSYLMRLTLALYGFYTGTLAQDNAPGVPLIKNFKPTDYSAGSQNYQIEQDRNGVVYVANNFGLLEFDGEVWEKHPTMTKSRSIAIGPAGKIYVGRQGDFGYFAPSQEGKWQYTSLADSLPSHYRGFDETWKVYRNRHQVFFCTFKYIFHYNEDLQTFDIIDLQTALDISHLVNGGLFFIARDSGLMHFENGKLRLLPKGDFFKDKSITSVLPYQQDKLLIFTFQHGAFVHNRIDIAKWPLPIPPAIINCAIRLKNGNYAIGTQNDGLFIITPEGSVFMHLSNDQGLNSRTVLGLFQDSFTNLWAAMNNGIALIELGSPFHLLNEEVGIPGAGYASFAKDGRLFLGTNTGLYASSPTVEGVQGGNQFEFVENSLGQLQIVV